MKNYNNEELIQAVSSSTSLMQVLLKLGLNPNGGGNYQTIRKMIDILKIDISHFTGKRHSKGKTYSKKSINDYLNNTTPIHSHRLKIRLIKEKILNHECSNCKLSVWNNSPIPIELDHIDGNNKNNNLENLRILCPNCHAQTLTYCNKKKNTQPKITNLEKIKLKEKVKKEMHCSICNVEFSGKRKHNKCMKCLDKTNLNIEYKTKIEWKPTVELIELAKIHGFTGLGKILGVSRVAIKNRIKKYPN